MGRNELRTQPDERIPAVTASGSTVLNRLPSLAFAHPCQEPVDPFYCLGQIISIG